MRHHLFTAEEVDQLLRASEGQLTTHRGERPGHAGSKHLLLTNADLLARYEEMIRSTEAQRRRRRDEARERGEKFRAGGPIYRMVTAFTAMPDMIAAGVATLNSNQAQAGMAEMMHGRGSEDGTRLEIDFASPTPIRMRYVMGHQVATMPVHQLTMILDRVRGRPQGLHVQTFFGGISEAALASRAILYSQNDTELLGFLGW